MGKDFFFWWSVFSTLLGVGFLYWDLWQFAINRKEKEIHKSQVKIWQHYAQGLSLGLHGVLKENFSSVDDVKKAVAVAAASTFSLYSSLNEERLFSEKEIKDKQLENEKRFKEINEGKPAS